MEYKRSKKLNATRIAQELWFHALAYYAGSPLKKALNMMGLSWSSLDSKIASAKYIEVNYDDARAWIYSVAWWAAYAIRSSIRYAKGYGLIYSYIHV